MPDTQEPQRSASQLKLLISQAERLGFWDDAIHWEKELAKLQAHSL